MQNLSKFILIAISATISAYCFAECPEGTKGGAEFEKAALVVESTLGQTLVDNSAAKENATDGRPLRLVFRNEANVLKVTLYSVEGKKYLGPSTTELCGAGDGTILATLHQTQYGDQSIQIQKNRQGLLTVQTGMGTYQFNKLLTPEEQAEAEPKRK